MAYQAYPSVAKTTLGGGSSLAEVYIPLWVYSSGGALTGSSSTSSGYYFLIKGGNSTGSGAVTNAMKLHTLNTSWASGQKFALEVSIYTANATYAGSAALWDFTTGAIVSGSTVSTTSTTYNVLRSAAITLIPGHMYGVTLWGASTTYSAGITKAHLVALLK